MYAFKLDAMRPHTFGGEFSVNGYIVGDTFYTTVGELRQYALDFVNNLHGSDDAWQAAQDLCEAADITELMPDAAAARVYVRDWAIEVVR